MIEEVAKKAQELYSLSEMARIYFFIASDDVIYEDEESLKCQATRCRRIRQIIDELSLEGSNIADFGISLDQGPNFLRGQ
ncbi:MULTISPECIES: hypothetical protein [Pseudomonas syringae group genomosp. 2]|uniref:hypothetical protein n=1 Tax=Pseudomonas syringae group genomosp. 2 TaxID=251698 RepID=UPI0009BDAC0A|nr:MULTISPECIES: hypothetical protein [Pseudomonas syringae group genomosp. 2]